MPSWFEILSSRSYGSSGREYEVLDSAQGNGGSKSFRRTSMSDGSRITGSGWRCFGVWLLLGLRSSLATASSSVDRIDRTDSYMSQKGA